MIAPTYTITTPIVNFVNSAGEECRNLSYFTNLIIERENTIGDVTFISCQNKSTFSILESEWIKIKREIKLNKILK